MDDHDVHVAHGDEEEDEDEHDNCDGDADWERQRTLATPVVYLSLICRNRKDLRIFAVR